MIANLRNTTKEISECISFGELTEEWLLYKKHRIKKSTYCRYKYIIAKYLLEDFNDIQLWELVDFNFNTFGDALLKKYQVKTVRDILVEFKSILKYAERKYGFDFKIDLISMPRISESKVKILNKEEEKKIKEFCFSSAELRDIGILLCLYTGIRIGEISALTWNDIDLKNNLLHINRTMERIYVNSGKTLIYIGEPKSKSSIRTIPLTTSMSIILKSIYKRNDFSGNEFFLTGTNEKFIEPRNYQYWFKKRLELLNISQNKFHILRHTFATNCIQIGMDVKSLSEVLGHSNVSVTLNKYVHSSHEMQKKYLEKL